MNKIAIIKNSYKWPGWLDWTAIYKIDQPKMKYVLVEGLPSLFEYWWKTTAHSTRIVLWLICPQVRMIFCRPRLPEFYKSARQKGHNFHHWSNTRDSSVHKQIQWSEHISWTSCRTVKINYSYAETLRQETWKTRWHVLPLWLHKKWHTCNGHSDVRVSN